MFPTVAEVVFVGEQRIHVWRKLGYPLMVGGLEYLFGASTRTQSPDSFTFQDWWAHDRDGEKIAFEGFVDWVFSRWQQHPGMHIYHYAAYEVSAVRRLSTRHDPSLPDCHTFFSNSLYEWHFCW